MAQQAIGLIETRGLVALVEGGEVDGVHGGVELFLALGLAVGVGGDQQFSRQHFLPKNGGVRTIRIWLDQ